MVPQVNLKQWLNYYRKYAQKATVFFVCDTSYLYFLICSVANKQKRMLHFCVRTFNSIKTCSRESHFINIFHGRYLVIIEHFDCEIFFDTPTIICFYVTQQIWLELLWIWKLPISNLPKSKWYTHYIKTRLKTQQNFCHSSFDVVDNLH